jgi:hypothetical protein
MKGRDRLRLVAITAGADTAGLWGLRTTLQGAGEVGKKAGLKRHAQQTRRAARRCAKVGLSLLAMNDVLPVPPIIQHPR